MRWRSFQASLTAMALVLAATAVTQAQDIDVVPGSATPSSKPAAAPAQPTTSALVDKSPTGSLGVPGRLEPAAQTGDALTATSPATAEDDDLDVDDVTKPATPPPSKDPLDAVKPDAATSSAGKPGPATGPAATPVTAPDQAPGAPPAPIVPAAAPLPPLSAAIKAALDKRDATGAPTIERRKERAAIDAYYAAHDFAPAWSEDGKPVAAVDPVLARLAKAADDALSIMGVPTRFVAAGTPEEVAASDIALTDAVVAYARQATGSRVDPRTISPLIGALPALADPAEVVDTIAAAGAAAGDALQAMNPIDPRYVALRDRLAELRGARPAAGFSMPPGPTLRLGMHDRRVPLLRARFGLDPADAFGDEDEYDDTLAEAVSRFQRQNGLPASGALTHRTVAALAGGGDGGRRNGAIEGAIEVNMEMWRWMPRNLGQDRIEVNVPAYEVTVYHDGEPVATNRVVVGKPDTPTPLFSNTMKYLIVNPVWNVPESIIKKEFLPKGDGYMAAHGFDVSWHHGRLVVKQPSGAKNALGRIKFMFPNDYSVYLHDTPSKSLFAASKRAFSHGCVRVDQPFDFAYDVLNDSVPEGGKVLWSEDRLDSMIGDKERYVNLPKPLPIHIEYFTASVDPESGRVVQLGDVYGYGHDVAVALGIESGPALVAERKPHRAAKTAIADEDPR